MSTSLSDRALSALESRCRLRELPKELREQIFWNAVVETQPVILQQSRRTVMRAEPSNGAQLRFERLTTPTVPTIAQTCRQFRLEPLSLFYPENAFITRLDPFTESGSASRALFALGGRILPSESRKWFHLEASIRDIILEFNMQEPARSAIHEASIRFRMFVTDAGRNAVQIIPGGRLAPGPAHLACCMCPLDDMVRWKLNNGHGLESIVYEFERAFLHKLVDPQQKRINISGGCQRCGKMKTAMEAEWSPYGKLMPVSPGVLEHALTTIEFEAKEILKPMKQCLANGADAEELRAVAKTAVEGLENYNLYW